MRSFSTLATDCASAGSGAADPAPAGALLRQAIALGLSLVAGLLLVAPLLQQAAGAATYAALHALIASFAVVVALLIFAIGWPASIQPQPANVVLLAAAFLAVGLLTLLHMLAYAGMPPFSPMANAEKAIFFWLTARLVSAIALLTLVLCPCNQPAGIYLRSAALAGSLGLVGLSAWVGSWPADQLPLAFIPGIGLTPLKTAIERLIAGLFLGATLLLLARRRLARSFNVPSLFFALLTLTASEICFSLSGQVNDGLHLLGYSYKTIAGIFLYHALFVGAIHTPCQNYAALQNSRARFHALDSALEEIIFILDREGRYTDIYGRWSARMGLSREMALGRTFQEIMGAEAAAVHVAANARAMAGESLLYDWTAPGPDGVRHFQTSLAPVRDPAGAITGLIGLSREVTDLKRAEAAAARQAEQRRRLLEVARSLLTTPAVEAILPQIHAALHPVVGYTSAIIYWYDAEAQVLRPAHFTTVDGWMDAAVDWPIPLGAGIIGAAAQSGRGELICHAERDPRAIYPPGVSVSCDHLITVPLHARGALIGMFVIMRDADPPFTPDDLDLVQLFAGYAALALANARLFEQVAQAEAHLRAAIDGSLDAFMTMRCVRDEQGRIIDFVVTDMNQQAAKHIGQPRTWLLGRSLRQVPAFVTAAHQLETIAAVVETGAPHESVVALHLPDGQTVWTQQQIVPLADGVAVSFRNVTERLRMEQALRDREETYRGFVEQSAEGLLLTDEQGVIIEFNAALAQQTGLARAEALGLPIWDLQVRLALPEMRTPATVAQVRAGFANVLAHGTAPMLDRPIEMRFLRPDGSARVVLQTLFAIQTARGFRLGGISRDITERHVMEQALRKSEERLSLVLEASNDGFWDWNIVTGEVHFSARWAGMLGYTLDEIASHINAWEQLLHPDDTPMVQERLVAHMAGRAPRYEVEHRLQTRTGEWRWILNRGQVMSRDADGRPLRIAGTHTDISERKALEAALHERQDELRAVNGQLRQLAITDGLTGLLNHRAFKEALTTLMDEQTAQPLALILLDIDHFKRYNDTYGHPAGDAALRIVASLLRGAVRANDIVARYGGEEFAVLAPGADAAAALKIAERCREALARHPWPLAAMTASLGVASVIPSTSSPGQLIAAADTALYAAKRAGRNCTRAA